MKISGTSTLTADRAAVYRALNDPAVLKESFPGCQSLELKSPTDLAATVVL